MLFADIKGSPKGCAGNGSSGRGDLDDDVSVVSMLKDSTDESGLPLPPRVKVSSL